MDRMENRRSTEGWRWLIRLVAAFSLPVISSIALAVAQLSRIEVVAIGAMLVGAGIVQRHRARVRTQDARYEGMQPQLNAESGFSRLWILSGIVLFGGGLLVAPIAVALVGVISMPVLLFLGLRGSRRSAKAEEPLGLGGRSAAEECGKVHSLAETVAGVLRLRPARRFVELANLRVRPGEVGTLQTLILSVIPIAFAAYASLTFAIGVSGVVQLPGRDPGVAEGPAEPGSGPPIAAESDGGGAAGEEEPTYAESCPEIPDPLRIGHHLGGLFHHDGAPKAGCGNWAREVPGTGVWVAAGNCENEMRSVAIYAPGYDPVLLYGEPARFAWAAALGGELVAAEAAEPEGGDVDIVETHEGAFAFARTSPSIEAGREDIAWCTEATGIARPFARLRPALAFLWVELVQDHKAWYWPEEDLSDPESPIAFVQPNGVAVARGGCDELTCHLEVDGERWPGGETAYISLAEFEPFIPPSAE